MIICIDTCNERYVVISIGCTPTMPYRLDLMSVNVIDVK